MLKAQENNLFGFKMKKESCKVEIDKCLIKCLPSITLSTTHLSLIVRIGPLLREDVGTLSNYLQTAGSTRAASGQSTQAHVAVLRSNLVHSLSFSESVKFVNGF